MFLDGPDAKARDAVHVFFAGTKVREDYPEPVPEIDQYELIEDTKTLTGQNETHIVSPERSSPYSRYDLDWNHQRFVARKILSSAAIAIAGTVG